MDLDDQFWDQIFNFVEHVEKHFDPKFFDGPHGELNTRYMAKLALASFLVVEHNDKRINSFLEGQRGPWISLDEAADSCNCSRRTIARAAKSGAIGSMKISKWLVVKRLDVERFKRSRDIDHPLDDINNPPPVAATN